MSPTDPTCSGRGADTPEPGPAKANPRHPRRVLLVEDNLINQQVAATLLIQRGHVVEVVNHGKEALDALERSSFDIVLMDMQMPVMDGLEATRHIRAHEAAEARPRQLIVALTANLLHGSCEACMAAGMDGYMTKPFRADDLYAAVEAPPEPGADGRPAS